MNPTLFYYTRKYASLIIPKKKNFYVFMPTLSRHKFAGNAKALQLYMQKEHKEIKHVLISQHAAVLAEGKEKYNLKTNTYFSLKGLWNQLRAEYIIVDASFSGSFDQGRFDLIQLWHGSGYKDVGLAYAKNANRLGMARSLKRIYSKYKLVAATSESDAKKQDLAFKTNTSKVTGYPRNDMFFEENGSLSKLLKEYYQLNKYKEIIVYTPTHRDEVFDNIETFSNKFWESLQEHLAANNSLFVVKRHPADEAIKIPTCHKNIQDWTNKVTDIQEFLLVSDLLITDYSSIATDFAITGKPIIIYAYDLEQYTKQVRSMYYDLEKTLPQPIVQREEELLEKIKDRSWQEDPAVQKSYDNFKKTFHKYLDGNSSKRVTEEILKL